MREFRLLQHSAHRLKNSALKYFLGFIIVGYGLWLQKSRMTRTDCQRERVECK